MNTGAVYVATRRKHTRSVEQARQAVLETLTVMVIVSSPVGRPGRALWNAFIERAIVGSLELEKRCFVSCLSSCVAK